MTGTWWLTRRHLRRRWVALVPVALIVALGATGTLVAAGAADRTAGAYAEYLDRAGVGDLVINPSIDTAEIDRVLRGLPGVRRVATDAILLAAPDDGRWPRPVRELDEESQTIQVRGSADGRYARLDRPTVNEGRLATGPDEAMVSAGLAEAEGIDVGDVLPLAFLWSRDDVLAGPDDLVEPVGVERLRVVGIVTFADEVLADELYPQHRIVVSPDVVERYDCQAGQPPPDASLEEAIVQLTPEGCATAYRYYSLDVGGPAGVGAATAAFERRSAELNEQFPAEAREQNFGYYLIATTTADEQQRVERSLQPTVTALGVLASAAGAVTVVVLGLAVARELRRSEHDQRQWWQLGLTVRERVLVALVPLAGAVVAGLALAVVAAWWLSPVGPVGSVRSVDPSPGRELSAWAGVAALAVGTAGVLLTAGLAVRTAWRIRRPAGTRRDAPAVRRLALVSRRPEVDEGVRAAYGSRSSALVVATCGVAAGVFLAAVVFGTSLASVLRTPASYGWPWDVGLMGGYGYGALDDVDRLEETLDGHEDVESWTGLGLTNDVSVDGEPALAMVGLEERAGVDFSVVEGRLPRAADEVALGTRTAAERGVDVGDRVELRGDGIEARRATVTGLAVLPPLGQFQADRASPGEGIVLPAATYGTHVRYLLTFVGVDLVPGADVGGLIDELGPRFAAASDVPMLAYRRPVRPPEIVNVRSMRAAPLVVGGLLAGTAVLGLVAAVVVSVRARRRELAILRALGFTGRQVRNSVRVQAAAAMAAALVLGVPLGIVAGRLAWRAFAYRLGVTAEPTMPGWWIGATVVGALVVVLAAAAVPARMAARIRPAAALRAE